MKRFVGADDIYLTKRNKIAVVKVKTYLDKHGSYHRNEITRYYPNTSRNMNYVRKIYGNIFSK